MTVTYDQYLKELQAFCKKHNKKAECKVETSPMINNSYHKNYMWSDGANWTECSFIVRELAECEIHGIKFSTPVDLWKTEYYSTESPSKYFYTKA